MLSKKNISILITVATLILFAAYFYQNRSDFTMLKSINPIYMVLASVCHFIIVFANGLLTKWIIKPYGKKMTILESYFLSLYASIGNFFLPVGSGLAIRAVYLKKKVALNYKNYMTTLYGNYMIVFLCNGVFGLAALYFLKDLSSGQHSFKTLVIVFLAMTLSTTVLVFHILPVKAIKRVSQKIGKIGRLSLEVINGWDIIAKQRSLLVRMISVTLIGFVALLGVNYFAVTALGLSVSFWALVLYTSIGSIALLLNITPGSIGIKEALYIFSSAALGLTVPQILSISIIDRLSKFFVLVIGWALMYINVLPGSKEFRKLVSISKSDEQKEEITNG